MTLTKRKVIMATAVLGKQVLVLPTPYQLAANSGIIKAASELDIDLQGAEVFYFEVQGHYSGNKKLAKHSRATYINHYRQLWRHLAKIGDYESMLMLVSPKLKNLPAQKAGSLMSFLRFKKMSPEQVLTETEGGVPVVDVVTKRVMMCEGGWKCNGKLKQFTSAISRLHRAHNHTDHYDDICPECVKAQALDANSRGCRQHAGRNARIFRRGNPTRDQAYLDVKDAQNDPTYVVRGCDALEPKDVRAIRKKLLAGNSVISLGAYTLILISVRLFLRSDEGLTIQLEHFIPECFARVGGAESRISGLCLKIKGKCDKTWKYYWLWVTDECPELCCVRHLFLYLKLSGIKEGYLFPPWEELSKPPADGVYPRPLSYSTFSKWFQRLLQEVLPNAADDFVTGLHMFRKSGYRFAIWGKGLWEEIKVDARHINDEDALNYAGDSWSSMLLANFLGDPENAVNTYRASYCKDPKISALRARDSTAAGVELLLLATEYVAALPVAAVVRNDLKSLLEAALSQVHTKPSSDLFKQLGSSLNADQQALLDQAVHQLGSEERARLQASAASTPAADITDPTAMFQNQKLPTTTAGKNDLIARKEVAGLRTLEEKVAKIQEIAVDLPCTTDLTGAAKTFVMRTLNPVIGCLALHFDGNVAAFTQHWRTSFKIKFSGNCCSGKGPCGFLNN
jgi:hypothetical protein